MNKLPRNMYDYFEAFVDLVLVVTQVCTLCLCQINDSKLITYYVVTALPVVRFF